MKLLVVACALLAAEAAKLEGYTSQVPSSGGVPLPTLVSSGNSAPVGQGQIVSSSGQSSISSGSDFSVSSGHTSPIHQAGGESSFGVHISEPAGFAERCSEGQVRHVDGSCVTPEVTRNVFVYAAPEQETTEAPLPENIPLPKIEHNIVFIRTQDGGNGQDPIIVPPPQKKHIIYVLNKESEQGQQVIEVPSHPAQNPEVYFVNYGEGETPTLPDGIDFETALNSAIHAEGQVIGGAHGLSAIDASNAFVSGTGSGSLFGSGASTAGGSFVSGSGASTAGGSFVSGSGTSAAGGSFVSGSGVGAGGVQATGGTFSGNNNIVGGNSGFISKVSQPINSGTGAPQPLYSTP